MYGKKIDSNQAHRYNDFALVIYTNGIKMSIESDKLILIHNELRIYEPHRGHKEKFYQTCCDFKTDRIVGLQLNELTRWLSSYGI